MRVHDQSEQAKINQLNSCESSPAESQFSRDNSHMRAWSSQQMQKITFPILGTTRKPTVVFSWDWRRSASSEHLPNKRTRGRRWIQPAHVGSSKGHNAHREILSPTSGHVAVSELSVSSACLRHLGRITRQAESTSRVLIGSGHHPMKARPKLELNSSKRRGHCGEGRADLTWMQELVLIHALWSTAWFPLLFSLRPQRWVRRLHSAR